MTTQILTQPNSASFEHIEGVKNILRLEHNEDDAILVDLYETALETILSYLGSRAIYPTQYKTILTREDVSCGVFLPKLPFLQDETHELTVFVSDENGDLSELDAENYKVIGGDLKQVIPMNDGFGDMPFEEQALVIEFWAGYSTMPAILKNAIRQMTCLLYEDQNSAIPETMKIGLSQFRYDYL